MRKTTILLSLMVLTAMVLAACGGGPTSTNVAPTQLPITAVASEPSTATEMPTETAVATESPAVPVTGASGAAGQMSERLRFKVMDQSGNQLGTVSDLVLNLSQAQVLYVIVNAQGNKVAVPRNLFTVQGATMTEPGTGAPTSTPSAGGAGTGLATATPAGIATGQTGTGLSTATPDTGMGLSTATPSTGGSGTGLSTATPSAGTGTGAGNALGQSAFIFQGDPAMLQNAPAFDVKNVPGLGQAPDSWDISIRKYWSAGSTSSGTSNTPEPVGTAVTDTTPTATGGSGTGTGLSTATPDTGTGSALSTSTPSVPVTGNGGMPGQGATSIQGVALASQVIGAKVTIGMQAVVVPSTGTGSSSATSTPSAGGTTSSTATPSAGGTGLSTATPGTGSATSTPSAGGTTLSTATPSANSGSGTNATVTGTIDDLLVNDAGTILYIVLRTNLSGGQTLIPVPLKFLQLDSDNAFVLNVDPAMLQSAPSFSNGQLPDMSTSGWDSEFNSFWQSNSGSGAANPTATP